MPKLASTSLTCLCCRKWLSLTSAGALWVDMHPSRKCVLQCGEDTTAYSLAMMQQVLDYVVFERHLTNPDGKWRLAGKIFPPHVRPVLSTLLCDDYSQSGMERLPNCSRQSRSLARPPLRHRRVAPSLDATGFDDTTHVQQFRHGADVPATAARLTHTHRRARTEHYALDRCSMYSKNANGCAQTGRG
jgi:hypothetical protein